MQNVFTDTMIYLNKMSSLEEKMLNQRGFRCYLFGRPYLDSKSMLDVQKRIIDFEPLTLNRIDIDEIMGLMIELSHYSQKYRELYIQLIQNRKKTLTIMRKINLSDQMTKVSSVLDSLQIDHVLDFSFKHMNEHTNGNQIHPYTFDIDLHVDILCVISMRTSEIMCRNLAVFAINYDRSGSRFELNDYLSQSYLQYMAIPLLRLGYGMDYRKVITQFLGKIMTTDQYLTINPLSNLSSTSKLITESFDLFKTQYQINHNAVAKLLPSLDFDIESGSHEQHLDIALIDASKTERLSDLIDIDEAHVDSILTEKEFKTHINKKFYFTEPSTLSGGSAKKIDDKFLEGFLKKYKPAKLNLSCYLKLKVLSDYQWIENADSIKHLKVGLSHIKMIRYGNELRDNKIKSSDVEDGGILIKGGVLRRGKIVDTDVLKNPIKRNQWTHLLLETNINKKTKQIGRFYRYTIAINSYYLFYLNLEPVLIVGS
jgi:hypothetical protein